MDEPKLYTRKQMIVAQRTARAEGRREAKEYLQERIVTVQNIITDCVEEIFRLDDKYPLTGVLIPRSFAERLINKFKKLGPDDTVTVPVELLQNIINRLYTHKLMADGGTLKSLIEEQKLKGYHQTWADQLQEYMDNSNPIDLTEDEIRQIIEELKNI